MAYNGNFIPVNKLQDKLVNIHQAFNTTKNIVSSIKKEIYINGEAFLLELIIEGLI